MKTDIKEICYDTISEEKEIDDMGFIKTFPPEQELHRDYVFREVKRCKKSPIYFINTYLKINHPAKGEIDFITYDYQDKCLKDIENNNFNAIIKSRQLGFSELMAAYSVWKLLFCSNENILHFGTKIASSDHFIRKMKYMIDKLPEWMLDLFNVDYRTREIIVNNNRIKSVSESSGAGKSETVTTLIFDEFAFFRNQEKLIQGSWFLLNGNPRGKMIFLSTPNGRSNEFYRMCRDEEIFGKELKVEEYPYNVHPERDEEWLSEQRVYMNPEQIAQELTCDFFK